MVRRFNQDGEPTDGIYDDIKVSCRDRYQDGYIKYTISKMWIETDNQEHFARLEDWMKKPWGTYPPLPLKKK